MTLSRKVRPLRSWKAVVLLLPLVMLGCFVPELADPTSLARGEDITLVLTPEGQARLGEITPVGGREVAGQLVDATADSLTLTARLSPPSSVPGAPSTLRQTMTFARLDIQQVTVPQLHMGRTAAVVGGALVIAGLLIADVFDFRGNSPPGDPGPQPPTPFRPRPY
jgi:hypothetical protein